MTSESESPRSLRRSLTARAEQVPAPQPTASGYDLQCTRMGAHRTLTDEALVERTAAGDEQAFETLFGRHEPLLRVRLARMISPRLRSKVSVSDLLQEARLAAYDGCPGFRPRGEGSVRAWLLRIAENKALEAVRRYTGVAMRDAGREAVGAERAEDGQLAGRGPSPSEVAMASELRDVVLRAMRRLPDDYREVLHLVGAQEMTFVEAGHRLGRTNEAIRKLYGRALAAFTKRLHEERGGVTDA